MTCKEDISTNKNETISASITNNQSSISTDRGGVAVAEGVEADAAGVVAGVLHAALHERRRRGQLALHLRLLVHPRREGPNGLRLPLLREIPAPAHAHFW